METQAATPDAPKTYRLDANGRLHRPDGTFANRAEIHAYRVNRSEALCALQAEAVRRSVMQAVEAVAMMMAPAPVRVRDLHQERLAAARQKRADQRQASRIRTAKRWNFIK